MIIPDEQLKKIIKDAGVLQHCLKRGSFNIHEIQSFLSRVAELHPQPAGRPKLQDRFAQQLENLNNGFSKKPKRHQP